jgi:hypothetical protein
MGRLSIGANTRRYYRRRKMNKALDKFEIYTLYGVCEVAAAQHLTQRGMARIIPKEDVPESHAFNELGQPAMCAVQVERRYVDVFETTIRNMRA